MNLQLSNKTALVSGSTAGIGFAIVKGLAREGATVYLNGRSDKRVSEAIEKIRSEVSGAKLYPLTADLGTAEGVETAGKTISDIDVLVNNLGTFEPKAFEDVSDDDWRQIFEVNVMSGVRLSRRYLPGMKARNWGRILFISSESAVQIPVEMIHYGMTKTAQLAVARGLAESLKGTAITVNSILAGPTRSEGVEKFIDDMASHQRKDRGTIEKEFFETARPSSLIQRFATIDEVANLAVYVAGELSSATTGAALRVDGGVVRSVV
jgi:NAD(P)-dependent dehydrogenase (short-subunit alcohol dehydrogenase family)